MAKSRAQRKAEQRRKREQGRGPGSRPGDAAEVQSDTDAQHDTQVPESAGVIEAEAAMDAGAAEAAAQPEPAAPAPSRDDTLKRGEAKQAERAKRRAAKESADRRKPREAPVEKERGRIASWFVSVWRELQRVQWPDRDTLVQASGVTLVFVVIAAAYLGALDAVFNFLVQRIL